MTIPIGRGMYNNDDDDDIAAILRDLLFRTPEDKERYQQVRQMRYLTDQAEFCLLVMSNLLALNLHDFRYHSSIQHLEEVNRTISNAQKFVISLSSYNDSVAGYHIPLPHEESLSTPTQQEEPISPDSVLSEVERILKQENTQTNDDK